MVMRGKGEIQTEILMVTTGNETDRQIIKRKLRNEDGMLDHPSCSSFSTSQTQTSPSSSPASSQHLKSTPEEAGTISL